MGERFYHPGRVTPDYGSNNVCENVCHVSRRPDHAHETAASTDPRINPG